MCVLNSNAFAVNKAIKQKNNNAALITLGVYLDTIKVWTSGHNVRQKSNIRTLYNKLFELVLGNNALMISEYYRDTQPI